MARPLRAVPKPTPRAVMYGRVSAVMGRGDDLTSPELQEHVVRDYCQRRGYDPIIWLCDVDRTGRSWSRRQVEHAVRLIEERQADLIVVPRWSRFTRNLRDYVIQTARIEAAGGRLESALEEADPATAAGLLQRDLFAILAQWESRKLGEAWKETHQRRWREGLPHRVAPRMGYQIVDGRHVPHPEEGPIVVELFARYLNGAGIINLCRWLADQGVMSPVTGRPWTARGLRYYLESGFPAGFLHVGDDLIPGSHPALITAKTWEAYTVAKRQRRGTPPRLISPTTPLSGLVYCASCRQRMRIKDSSPRQGVRGYYYVCESLVACPNRASMVRTKVEAAVKDWLRELADGQEARAAAAAARRAAVTVRRVDRQQLLRELAKVEKAIIQNRADHLIGGYSVAERDAVDVMLREQKATLEVRLEQLTDDMPGQIPTVGGIGFLLENWERLPAEQVAKLLKPLVRRVWVVRKPGWRQNEVRVQAAWEVS